MYNALYMTLHVKKKSKKSSNLLKMTMNLSLSRVFDVKSQNTT